MVLYIILLVVLVAGSAACSFAEALLVGRSAEMIHSLSKSGSRNSSLLTRLMHGKDTLLSVVLLGNNICNVMVASVSSLISVRLFTDLNRPSAFIPIVNTIVITPIIFLLGEVLPKSVALSGRYRVGGSVMLFITFLNKILYPLVVVTDWIVRKILRTKPSSQTDDTALAQQELKMTVEAKHLEGKIFTHYRDMLNGLLNLGEVTVGSVMRHKSDVMSINLNAPLGDIVLKALKSGYSRFPIFDDSQDNIIGILHIRDVFDFYHRHGQQELTKEKLRDLSNAPLFITENASLYQQMLLFRTTRNHMAVVVDEFGVFSGVITLEDILEEIVGEIDDEHDKDEGDEPVIADGAINIKGDYPTHDLSRRFNIDLGDSDAKTVAGLIIDNLERLPTVGERLEMFGYSVTVKGMKQNKITDVEMKKMESL